MFIARAYLNRQFIGLMENIESHNPDECINFIWEQLQKGSYCTLQYGNTTKYYSPDFFNEYTVDIYDCIVDEEV